MTGVLFLCLPLFAQDKQKASDTIYHYEDKYLYKQQRFYEKWKTKAMKRKWSKELFNILLDPPTETTPSCLKQIKSSSQSLIKYEGMRIEKIHFHIVKPFGISQDGLPTDSTDNKLEAFGNSVHMITKEHHLKRLLSIYEGDFLDIKQLQDNEEMLRSLAYINELFITAEQLSENSIALNFLIKDKFSWSVSYQAHSLKAHKFKLYNKNLFGIGHYAKLHYFYSPNKYVVHNWGIEYTVPSIGKSLIRASTIVEHSNSHDKYSVELERPFVDYKTQYAGGLYANFIKNSERVPTNEIAQFPNSINYHETDAWLGVRIPYDLQKTEKYARYRKALTGRIYRLAFTKTPDIRIDSNAFLLNTTGILLGYNVSQRQLYLSNMLYNYGKVEYIPYGHLAQLFVGGAYNQKRHEGYMGGNFEKAYYNQSRDYYLLLRFFFGTFFDKNGFLDGLISTEAKYISKLYRFRNTGHRHFVKLRYVMGCNTPYNFLNINENNGLRNLQSSYSKGNKKIVLNIEDVFFSPYTIAGFRSTFFSFADLAYIKQNSNVFRNNRRFYAGIGLGVRFHNHNFVFETFQLSFSLFLKRPPDTNFFTPDATSVKTERFRNFRIKKPRFFFEKEQFR